MDLRRRRYAPREVEVHASFRGALINCLEVHTQYTSTHFQRTSYVYTSYSYMSVTLNNNNININININLPSI